MTKSDIYFDLLKRNLETRRQIIFAAVTVVLGFGVWILQQDASKIPDWDPWFWRFVVSFFLTWAVYFGTLHLIEANVTGALSELVTLGDLTQADAVQFEARLNLRTKYAPFLLSVVTSIIVVVWPAFGVS